MAPLATTSPNSRLYGPSTDDTMMSAMESESTDSENSLLSCSGTGADSVASSSAVKHLHPRETVKSPAANCVPLSPFGDKSFGEQPPEMLHESEKGLEESFYFETDHLALKGNADYHLLLRTVALLEAQRQKAIQDMDKLTECRKRALEDPIGFVDKLQRQVDLGIPAPQTVTEIPHIDWERYTSTMDPLTFKQPKHMTRHTFRKHTDDAIMKSLTAGCSSSQPSATTSLTKSVSTTASVSNHSNVTSGPSTTCSVSAMPVVSMATTSNGSVSGDSTLDSHLVRGRVKDQSKPATFNKLWTVEEQRRLEELLIKFPSEEVEMRRWAKVAEALGNRTTKQVASRVQKYFIKLAKAGIQIPGRMPSVPSLNRKHRHQRHHRFLLPSSTFLSSHEPPVYMTEDDDDGDSWSGAASSVAENDWNIHSQDVSDEEEIPVEMRESEEYRELMHYKRLRRQKQDEATSRVQHVGYKCDRCDAEPIVGVRWHCADCPPDTSVDFCDNCADFVFETKDHKSAHRLEAVKEAEVLPTATASTATAHLDRDYTKFLAGDYNYLDPNYMPAT